jgi:hypothetical protein
MVGYNDDDYLYMDGLRTFTHSPRNRTESSSDITGLKGRVHNITSSDVIAGAAFGVTTSDRKITLFTATFGDEDPMQGDYITDTTDSTVYTILTITKIADGSQISAMAREAVS